MLYLIISVGLVFESCLNEVKMFRNYCFLDCEGFLILERFKIGCKVIFVIVWNILRISFVFFVKMFNLIFFLILFLVFN